ncbi:MAG: histidine kinase [Rhodobacteraceae bacterium]|nr:histidine kinase [Paracoccaceae bacterium]
MNGKIISGGIVAITAVFGVSLYYSQYYGYYQEVSGLTSIAVEGREIAVSDYVGIDADSSGLKLRGCFTVDPTAFDGVAPPANPTPLTPPKWFECFDPVALEADLESGLAVAYMAAENEKDGIDRVVAVYPDGRAYQWRQLNEKYQD